jgi:hypothetical protein
MKKIYGILFLIVSLGAQAQYENSSFTNTGRGCATTFATDYETVGINPANLGWDWKYSKKKFAMGFAEFGASISSDALTKTQLRNSVSAIISGNSNNLSYQDKTGAASTFAQAGNTMNVDISVFGAALTTKKAGGFAFRINDHMQLYTQFGSNAANLFFLGKTSSIFDSLTIITSAGTYQNIANHPNLSPDTAKLVAQGYSNAPQLLSKILNGSEIKYMWTREYNFSYGRKIFGDSLFALFGGVGIKYVQGLALMDIQSNNNQLTGYSSLSPAFNINYGTAAAQANQVNGSGGLPKTVGNGYGFDFGVNVIIKNKLKIGVAVNNVGSIVWKGNAYRLKDTFLIKTTNAGLQNYNMVSQLSNMFSTGAGGLISLQGEKSITTQLPGNMRAGASLVLGKKGEIGVDFIVPLNSNNPGSFQDPVISIGGDFMPIKWLKLQAGFVHGGYYGNQIPLGIIFVAKGGAYEAGIASRDIVTFFTQSGPNLSLSMGFMRVRF